MNALVNLKKNTWVCMFCGKNYQSSIEHDRLDTWMETPSCSCTKSWEYKCISSKKEAKEFRSKYAKYIILKGKIIPKDQKFQTFLDSKESISDEKDLTVLFEKANTEKNLSIKVSLLENIIKELSKKIEKLEFPS